MKVPPQPKCSVCSSLGERPGSEQMEQYNSAPICSNVASSTGTLPPCILPLVATLALSADAPIPTVEEVRASERVPCFAGVPLGVLRRDPLPTEDVDLMRHRLQVSRSIAQTVTAQVIQFQPLRYGTVDSLVGGSVSQEIPTFSAHLTVPFTLAAPRPHPAGVIH